MFIFANYKEKDRIQIHFSVYRCYIFYQSFYSGKQTLWNSVYFILFAVQKYTTYITERFVLLN